MTRAIALITLLLTILSCAPKSGFLEPVPPPPPGPPRYEKTYQFPIAASEKGSTDVDILWMIDDSSSMGTYQRGVIAGSAAFMSGFTSTTNLHWRMGLISSTLDEAPYMGFQPIVDWQTPNGLAIFNTGVDTLAHEPMTNARDCCEQTFQPVMDAVTKYNFLRPGAFLIVIAVTDEPERGIPSVDEFLQFLEQKVGGSRYSVFGVFKMPWEDSTVVGPGSKYKEVTDRTKGKIYDINSNFGVLMADLGRDLLNRTVVVSPHILLDQIPKPETIRVTYRGRTLRPGPLSVRGEWTYDPIMNVIEINDPKLIDISIRDVKVSFEVDFGNGNSTGTGPKN